MVDYSYFDKVLAIFSSCLILFNGYLISVAARTWFVPGGIISIFWFSYTFFPLVILFNVPVNSYSLWYIFLSTFFFSVSSYVFDWRKAFFKNQKKIRANLALEFHSLFLRNFFYLIQASVICILIIDILSQGFSFHDMIFNIMETSKAYISLRYADDLNRSAFSRVSTVLTYLGVMIGGLVFCSAGSVRKKSFTLFVSFLPSIIVMVIQGAKGTLFLCAAFFYSTLLVYKLYVNKVRLTDKATNKNLILIILLLFPAIVSSFLSRGLYGENMGYVVEKLVSYFSSYAFAHVYAFSDWFSFYIGKPHMINYETQEGYSYGFYTFMSIFKAFGSSVEVPMGTYGEYFNYQDFIKTNVYTLFRGAILDFGLIGTFLFMFLLGLVANISFYVLLCSTRPYFSISFFSIMAGFYYTCFISVFIWNSIIVVFFLFAIVLILNRKFYIFELAIRRSLGAAKV